MGTLRPSRVVTFLARFRSSVPGVKAFISVNSGPKTSVLLTRSVLLFYALKSWAPERLEMLFSRSFYFWLFCSMPNPTGDGIPLDFLLLRFLGDV